MIVWLAAVLISVAFLPSFFSQVNYNITGGFGGPSNSESQKAANMLHEEFPSTKSNASSNAILVLLQGTDPYSPTVKSTILSLNKTLARNQEIVGYTGMESLYTTESGLLSSSLPSIAREVAGLETNVSSANRNLYSLEGNLSTLSNNIFQLEHGINQTAQLVYGIPSSFVEIWSGLTTRGVTNPTANKMANATLYQATEDFGGSAQSIQYYSAFYMAWNSTFLTLPGNTTSAQREAVSVQQTVGMFLTSPSISNETKQTMQLVSSGLSVASWNRSSSISNLTVATIAAGIPTELPSSLGTSAAVLTTQLYALGPSPSSKALSNFSIDLLARSLSTGANSSGISVSELLNSAYALGESPTFAQEWDLASSFVANSTASAFTGSPLFHVNSTALAGVLSTLSGSPTLPQIDAKTNEVISTQSFLDYPLVPTRALTQDFVSEDNRSMLIVLNFASASDANTIAQVQSTIKNSSLETLGTVYVTGGAVITQDVQNVFTPALTITVGPGVVVSILIVGVLFLSPIAAIIPIMMGGISIAIALPTIYFETVDIAHGSVTFLTPTLVTLLMLGLSVDYAVLQLRRTREERLNGKSLEDSVGISMRWAGQAVLTAGVTVIVAYVVMAVANVPLFSSVGTSIALGVSILLVASLTLLPSLELSLGDRMFWPGMRRSTERPSRSRLRRVTEATLKRKAVVVALVSLFAIGAFYATYRTPVGQDFLKLIPDFPSNQGLTAIGNSFGEGLIAPTQVLVTMPSAITYGDNQFNQTILNEIEQISNVAANSSGVMSVAGPTRPYGSPFDYSSVGSLPETIRSQYEGGMFALIGTNNRTALINVGLSGSSESQAAVNSLLGMEKSVNKLANAERVTVYYGGEAQQTYDSQSFLTGLLPEVIVTLAAAVYVILFIQLRSAFTPLRLIFTILCSVVFSLAILSVVFYSILGLPILDFAPLFVVVTMLGVGVDYDIFFVTRIREEVLAGETDADAITTAVQRVWVTILGLGLVLVAVFSSLIVTGIAILSEIGAAVAVAIFLDVVVTILFFVPALMGLAQRFNWWPSKVGRQNTKRAESE